MDKVADMLTVIRNAQAAGKPAVAVPYSALKYNIAKILERRGYVATVEKRSRKFAGQHLCYPDGWECGEDFRSESPIHDLRDVCLFA